MRFKACIFDLDGVIVDTARYHYYSWVTLCKTFGFEFSEKDNEHLKGVNREQSLEIILNMAGKSRTPEEKSKMRDLKNQWFLKYVDQMTSKDVLPGIKSFLMEIQNFGLKIALASASKNAITILKQIQLSPLFDAMVDGNHVIKGKPDPEVFLRACRLIDVKPHDCLVFEDSRKGIIAAKSAGMKTVGIGDPVILNNSDVVIPGFENLTWPGLIKRLNRPNHLKSN